MDRAVEVAEERGAILPATFAATKLAVRRPMVEAVRAQSSNDSEIIDYWCSAEVREKIEQFVQRTIKAKA